MGNNLFVSMSVAQQNFVFVFNISKLKLQQVSELNPY